MELINTIKGICIKILSIGTPSDKDVLYSEVIKKEIPKQSAEALTLNEIKETITHLFKSSDALPSQEVTEFSRGTPTPPPLKATPSKPKTAKNSVSKKTETVKPTQTKKTSATKTKAEKSTPKKSTANTKTAETISSTKKSPARKAATPKGGKRAEKIALYIKDIKKHYGEVDEEFVAIVVKNLGPSIYKKDAELVSCSDPKELDTVRKNFLMKKLGIDASKGVLDAAISDVCEELKSARNKYRATFYYALAKKFKKESVLS